MRIAQLEVTDLRNIAHASITPCTGVNLLWGANASGKTSMLEAIHLLGLGRSFRASSTRPLVREGSDRLVVFGRLLEGQHPHRVGIQKLPHGPSELRIDGARGGTAAQLASLLPLQLITPASHELVEGGPKERRAFLDWGLFHVEQSFYQSWKAYRRAVKQRNEALKRYRRPEEPRQWNSVLIERGEQIDAARQRYVSALTPYLGRFVEVLLDATAEALEVTYLRGWASELPLAEALAQAEGRDLKGGFTSVGPHRADLRLRWHGRAAAEQLSRGQQKMLVVALKLAQMALLRTATGIDCVVLIDDLPAELDRAHRVRLLELLADTGAQTFLTATERELVDLSPWSERKLFHVEHGQVTEVV